MYFFFVRCLVLRNLSGLLDYRFTVVPFFNTVKNKGEVYFIDL